MKDRINMVQNSVFNETALKSKVFFMLFNRESNDDEHNNCAEMKQLAHTS
jgi:hypothetical protein